ncbi:Asp/Glu racemase [Seohaeicola saemankumensis]|uniref:Asp/Glu racemase n=1 Tax=Seohaeicola saemankumensis TaxID=481181 RepID=A0ABW3TAW6_9RHOB
MSGYPYRLTTGHTPTLGLIVLQVDETIEQDFRRLLAPEQVKLHVSRVPSGAELTPDTIAGMEAELAPAAALLPPAAHFDAVGYACTSGTTLIGAARVHALVAQAVQTRAVTDPLTAALAAIDALGLRQVGIVSPYVASVAGPIRRAFETGGINVPATVSFGEEVEARVARIDPVSIADAARDLARDTALDGLFLSCTNLRTLDIIPTLEAELGLPVLSSNQVLCWHMAKLAGIDAGRQAPGRIFAPGR